MDLNSPDNPPEQLIAAARAGDSRAFAQLITPYRDPMLALLARRESTREDAEDALQEVLFLAWRGLARYDHRGRFSAWLFTIAYRVLAARRRSARPVSVALTDMVAAADATDARVEQRELLRAMRQIVSNLPQPQREVFLLRQSSTLTFAEIADLMQLPLGTVLSHMHLVMRKIHDAASQP